MNSSGHDHPQRWRRLGTRPVAHTRIFDVQGVQYQHPARPEPREFIVVHAPDWVNVVALTPAHELVLVRQFRYGIDDFSLEIPGGVRMIQEYYRQMRKFGCNILGVVQQYEVLKASELRGAMIVNS